MIYIFENISVPVERFTDFGYTTMPF